MTAHHDNEPVRFTHGRAHVPSTSDSAELTEALRDGGRGAIVDGSASLTDWLVWDWTRVTDERIEQLDVDMFDLADRVHVLNVIVICVFLVIVVALAIVIAAVVW
jgi:hypothetical protein